MSVDQTIAGASRLGSLERRVVKIERQLVLDSSMPLYTCKCDEIAELRHELKAARENAEALALINQAANNTEALRWSERAAPLRAEIARLKDDLRVADAAAEIQGQINKELYAQLDHQTKRASEAREENLRLGQRIVELKKQRSELAKQHDDLIRQREMLRGLDD